MLVWIPFSLVTLLLAYLGDANNSVTKNFSLYRTLLAVWLAWFVSFGGGAMTDHANYVRYYNSFDNMSMLGPGEMIVSHIKDLSRVKLNLEIGYVYSNILFNSLGFSFVGFSFFYAIVVNILFIRFIYRHKSPILIFLVYISSSYYTQQANLVRQMMAASIFLYATKFIIEKNIFKYIVGIFIASLFHVSALILIPIYFIIDRNYNKFILIVIWGVTVTIYFVQPAFGFVDIIRKISFVYYDAYFTQTKTIWVNTGFNWITNAILIPFLLLNNSYWSKNRINSLVFNIFYIGVVLENLGGLSELLYRLALYFFIAYVIMVPNMATYIKGHKELRIRRIAHYMVILIILYHSYLLFSFAFRPGATGITLGSSMYEFSDIFKE